MKSILLKISMLVIASLLISCSEKPLTYIYTDGNNNNYRLTSEMKLIYEPITPELSSSGIYSGGNPKEVMLCKKDYKELTKLIMSTFNNKENHIETRNMGTAMIKLIFTENKTQSAFIRGDAKQNILLNKVLEGLKQ